MDLWEKAKKAIPAGLGFLVNAIAPGTGGFAASLISDVLGCDDTPEGIETALVNITPEQTVGLRKAVMAHKERLIELAHLNEKMYLEDKGNARQRQVDSERATGKRDINLYIIAWTVIIGFFGLVGFLIFFTIPPANLGPVNQLFGAIAAGFGMILSYFFGSSKSSSDKTAMMVNKK